METNLELEQGEEEHEWDPSTSCSIYRDFIKIISSGAWLITLAAARENNHVLEKETNL